MSMTEHGMNITKPVAVGSGSGDRMPISGEIPDTMLTQVASVAPPEGGEPGFKIEHILLTVTIVHTREIGQLDDSAAYLVKRELSQYNGVLTVDATALYDHVKEEVHVKNCTCHWCTEAKQKTDSIQIEHVKP